MRARCEQLGGREIIYAARKRHGTERVCRPRAEIRNLDRLLLDAALEIRRPPHRVLGCGYSLAWLADRCALQTQGQRMLDSAAYHGRDSRGQVCEIRDGL